MKFFLVLALVGLASATLNYNANGRTLVLNGQNAYGNLLSSGSYGGSSYGSGSLGTVGLVSGGLSGLSLGGLGGGYSGSYGSGLGSGYLVANAAPALALQTVQAVPVSLAAQQVAVAAPVANIGYSAGFAGGYRQQQAQVTGPIQAAVISQRNVQVVDVPSTGGAAAAQSVVIGPSVQPLDIEFQSQSSPVSVRQTHIPGQPNQPQYSSHQEEPDYLKQEIVKPVVHEVTEAIQPYRRITQEVRPVQETIQQLITRGQQQQVQAVAVQAQPALQTVAVQAQPALQTVAVAQPALQTVAVSQPALQTVSVAQPSLALVGSVAPSASFAVGQPSYSLNIQNLNAKPSLALSGSTSFSSLPSSSLSLGSLGGSSSYGSSSYSSGLSAPDNYRRRA